MIVQVLENSNILLKGITKTIKNKIKEQKGGFFSMLLGTLDAILIENMLPAKGVVRAGSGEGIVRAGSGNKKRKGTVRPCYGNEMDVSCRLIL